MKCVRAIILGLIIAMTGALPSMAATYECTINKRSMNNTWIAPKITFIYDEASGTVRIDDANIREVWDIPVPGKVLIDNNKKIRFSWLVRGMKNNKNPTVPDRDIQRGFVYSASYWKATGKLTVTLFDNTHGRIMGRITGEGTCDVKP